MDQFLQLLKRREESSAVTPSALRNMASPGTTDKLRAALASGVNLRRLARCQTVTAYRRALDLTTDKVRASLPKRDRHWGMVRKILNIYLRNALYNAYLSNAYDLARIDTFMEVPLDSHVAKWLKSQSEGQHLPRWKTVKHLTPEANDDFQTVARSVARRLRTASVHLDVWAWRQIAARGPERV